LQTVYLLWHTHKFDDGREDDKLLGVYESEAEAVAAKARVTHHPGFVENPEGFCISPYALNKDNWTSGYVTVD
jgi:hypothetical protein